MALFDGLNISFEFELKKNDWYRLPNEVNRNLIDLVEKRDCVYEFDDEKLGDVDILLDKMVMRSQNGFERRLRCCVLSSNGDGYVAWEHLMKITKRKSHSISFDCREACRLEKAHMAGEDIDQVTIRNEKIKVDDLKELVDSTNAMFDGKFERVLVGDLLAAASYDDLKQQRQRFKREEAEDLVPPPKPAAKPTKAAANGKRKPAAAKAKGADAAKVDSTNGGEIKSRRVELADSLVPVDEECPIAGRVKVYDANGQVFHALLNQTNIESNNNKYYIMQVLVDDKNRFFTWFRWGRVGYKGQSSLQECGGSSAAAIDGFQLKFRDKTKNDWEDRETDFVKVKGKYDYVKTDVVAKKIDENEDAKGGKKKNAKKAATPECSLAEEVQKLLKTILNMRNFEQTVAELNYDPKKAPLGKLSLDQIKVGNVLLNDIAKVISKSGGKATEAQLREYSNQYYSTIPHVFGFSVPPVIHTNEMITKELDLLDALSQIEYAVSVMTSADDEAAEHPLVVQYTKLDCGIEPLPASDQMYKTICKFFNESKGPTHAHTPVRVSSIYALNKRGDLQDFGNNYWLFHGSRLSNWAGILSRGLRIAPPEAPVTGWMFGKGVYFADVSTKSANYCYTNSAQTKGYLVLSKVSLGEIRECYEADYEANKLPKGKHSVKGIGQYQPKAFKEVGGAHMNDGKLENRGNKNAGRGLNLFYNEYIVYDTRQIDMKYLLELEFDYD